YTWFGAHAGELGYDDFAYLDRIAVVPQARRHGVGRAMYARLVDDLTGSVPDGAHETPGAPHPRVRAGPTAAVIGDRGPAG
ncbi:MAG: GNAT family N-acetyltransferase, partial [Ilumatobacteraceae bacterium]